MSKVLGIDTSNYATSVAVFDTQTMDIFKNRILLPVKEGALGLRQSDAVFHHTKQLPNVISYLKEKCDGFDSIGVSSRPRWSQESYMPCFLVGETVCECISAVNNCDLFKTSHQVGHILAALYSCNKLDFIKNKKTFLAFHVSGGTTDLLLCTPDDEEVIKTVLVGSSLDLKAGQLVDRVGLMLGLQFPCGVELEKIAEKSNRSFKIKPTLKNNNCCLSGCENLCKKMFDNGESAADISKFLLDYIYETIKAMTLVARDKYSNVEIIYAGGVMSDKIISDKLKTDFDCCFATPDYSCDNAAGVAIFAAIKKGLI